MPTYTSTTHVARYVDTSGISTADLNGIINDAEQYITVMLSGASLNSTAFRLVASLQSAIAIAGRDPTRLRVGQFESDYGERVADWRRIIKDTIRQEKMSIRRA